MSSNNVWLSNIEYNPGNNLNSTTYRKYTDVYMGNSCSVALFPSEAVGDITPDDIILFSSEYRIRDGEREYTHATKVVDVVKDPELVREMTLTPSETDQTALLWGSNSGVHISLDPTDLAKFSVEDTEQHATELDTQEQVTTSESVTDTASDGIRRIEYPQESERSGGSLEHGPSEAESNQRAHRSFNHPGPLSRLSEIDPSVKITIEDEWGSFWEYIHSQSRFGDGIRKPLNEISLRQPTIITGPCHLGKERYVRSHVSDTNTSPMEIVEVFLDENYDYGSFVERMGPDGTVQDGILKIANQRASQKNRRILLLLHNLHEVDIETLFGETLEALRGISHLSPRQDVSSFFNQSCTPRLRYSQEPFEFAGRQHLQIVGLFDTVGTDGTIHRLPQSICDVFVTEEFKPDPNLVYLLCGLGEKDPSSVLSGQRVPHPDRILLMEAVNQLNSWLDREEVQKTYRLGHEPILSADDALATWVDTYLPFLQIIMDQHDLEAYEPLNEADSYQKEAIDTSELVGMQMVRSDIKRIAQFDLS